MQGKLPASGTEPRFAELPWGTKKGVRGSNCYDYSIGDFRNARPIKTTPGDLAAAERRLGNASGRAGFTYNKCSHVVPFILADNPQHVYREAEHNPCKPGYHKIQSFVGAGANGQAGGDFHFYRQNGDILYTVQPGDTVESIAAFVGIPRSSVRAAAAAANTRLISPGTTLLLKHANLFSHKAGWATGAMLKDSCGRAIQNPRKACRKGAVDYTSYCGSFCVKAGTRSSV